MAERHDKQTDTDRYAERKEQAKAYVHKVLDFEAHKQDRSPADHAFVDGFKQGLKQAAPWLIGAAGCYGCLLLGGKLGIAGTLVTLEKGGITREALDAAWKAVK